MGYQAKITFAIDQEIEAMEKDMLVGMEEERIREKEEKLTEIENGDYTQSQLTEALESYEKKENNEWNAKKASLKDYCDKERDKKAFPHCLYLVLDDLAMDRNADGKKVFKSPLLEKLVNAGRHYLFFMIVTIQTILAWEVNLRYYFSSFLVYIVFSLICF